MPSAHLALGSLTITNSFSLGEEKAEGSVRSASILEDEKRTVSVGRSGGKSQQKDHPRQLRETPATLRCDEETRACVANVEVARMSPTQAKLAAERLIVAQSFMVGSSGRAGRERERLRQLEARRTHERRLNPTALQLQRDHEYMDWVLARPVQFGDEPRNDTFHIFLAERRAKKEKERLQLIAERRRLERQEKRRQADAAKTARRAPLERGEWIYVRYQFTCTDEDGPIDLRPHDDEFELFDCEACGECHCGRRVEQQRVATASFGLPRCQCTRARLMASRGLKETGV